MVPESRGSCLVLLDFQQSVVHGVPAAGLPGIADGDALVASVAEVAAACRQEAIPVIHVRVAFRPGHPEIADGNKQFAPVKGRAMVTGSPETEIVRELQPHPGDIVVTKYRVGAFRGTELALILGSLNVHTLVIAGLHTSGAVLSTIREAADRDFRVLVVRDGCADADESLHSVLMDKVFPSQAEVVTVAELLSDWPARAGDRVSEA
jgi:nicotinamidase-related amidase